MMCANQYLLNPIIKALGSTWANASLKPFAYNNIYSNANGFRWVSYRSCIPPLSEIHCRGIY